MDRITKPRRMLQGYRCSRNEKVKVKERQRAQERWIQVVAFKKKGVQWMSLWRERNVLE